VCIRADPLARNDGIVPDKRASEHRPGTLNPKERFCESVRHRDLIERTCSMGPAFAGTTHRFRGFSLLRLTMTDRSVKYGA
jgi:hypothetical protein